MIIIHYLIRIKALEKPDVKRCPAIKFEQQCMADELNNVIDIGLDLAEPFYRQKDFSVSCWSGKETRNI